MSIARAMAIFRALVAAFLIIAGPAYSQAFPSKSVRIIVPFPPGGPTDVATRVIAQKASENWGQPVLVVNMPGGNTFIGAEAVAKAAPDGYTLLMAIDSTLSMNPSLYQKLPYDPIRDFAPVTLTFWSPIILVVGADGPKTVKELIAYGKANPGKLNYGAGTITNQLGGELFKGQAGLDMVFVPYKGGPGPVQGLLTGEIQVLIGAVTSSVPHIKSGKFRVLASLGTRPVPGLPDIPTLADAAGLPGYDVAIWSGLVAPAATRADIIQRLQQEMVRVLSQQDVKDRLFAVGLDPATNTPEEFGAFIKSEAARWSKVIKQTAMKVE